MGNRFVMFLCVVCNGFNPSEVSIQLPEGCGGGCIGKYQFTRAESHLALSKSPWSDGGMDTATDRFVQKTQTAGVCVSRARKLCSSGRGMFLVSGIVRLVDLCCDVMGHSFLAKQLRPLRQVE